MATPNGFPVFTPLSPSLTSFKRHNRVNLRFRISYYTKWGENLMVSGSDVLFGNWNVRKGVWMSNHHEGQHLIWTATISVPENFRLEYNYCVVDEKLDVVKWDSSEKRRVELPDGIPDGAFVDIIDTFQDGVSPEKLLMSSAFRNVIFQNHEESQGNDLEDSSNPPYPYCDAFSKNESIVLRFRIVFLRLERDQNVFVLGNNSMLGNMDENGACPLLKNESNYYEATVLLYKNDFPIRYRYILKNESNQVIKDNGEEYTIDLDPTVVKSSSMIIVSDGYFRARAWRGAGIAIPVFSLLSSQSLGCGEFSDLKLLIDFTKRCGMNLVQILPVNDTSVYGTWWDSYPYSSLSVFALHPLYLRLQSLSENLPKEIMDEIESARMSLDSKQVDYEKTMAIKIKISKKVFMIEKSSILNSLSFIKFFEENKDWLKPYAAFCFLKDLFGTSDYSQWGLYSNFSPDKLDKLVNPSSDHYDAISFRYYLQYHLYLQLKDASDHARRNKIMFKGDLPIGVDKHSVDTWVWPRLFRARTSTGAPPDDFSLRGQNWGFPTYDWHEMSKDNYAWWRARLSQMAKFFTAYRIDHVLGFFRIWELPDTCVSGILGKFRPSIPLSAEEMEKEGVWDFNRLAQPYIRTHILKEMFGSGWNEIASRFFDQYEPSCYRFKEEYDTEKKIVSATKPRFDSPDWLVKESKENEEKLLSLFQNVVLIRDINNARTFYPRFFCDMTSNFKELNDHSKTVIKKLYHDYYFIRQEKLWKENALKTLPVLLNSSDMLACGEDLGLVPACVPPVLKQLGLLGLKIQRMSTEEGEEFGNPANYDYMTVCAPSCHDTSTLRAWWEEDASRRSKFSHKFFSAKNNGPTSDSTIDLADVEPPKHCTPEIARAILQQHFASPSIWAIIPLQDIFALKGEYAKRPAVEETINDPTNPKHYWRFRVHVSMERLLDDSEFIESINRMLIAENRASKE